MSAIRDKILQGLPAIGTPHEGAEWLIESISNWTEGEKAAVRKSLDEAQLLRRQCSDRIN